MSIVTVPLIVDLTQDEAYVTIHVSGLQPDGTAAHQYYSIPRYTRSWKRQMNVKVETEPYIAEDDMLDFENLREDVNSLERIVRTHGHQLSILNMREDLTERIEKLELALRETQKRADAALSSPWYVASVRREYMVDVKNITAKALKP